MTQVPQIETLGNDEGAPDLNRLVAQKTQLVRFAARDRKLNHLAVRVFIAATDYVHRKPGADFGLLWPSIATLAGDAGTNDRSVHRALTRLTDRHYLVPVRRGGGRTSTGQGRRTFTG